MIVDRYKKRPVPSRVAVLTRDGVIVDEAGNTVNPDAWPDGLRAWCEYDTARDLVNAGHGETLCWNHEEIRWRHRRFEDGWKQRPSDVAVIKIPFPDDERNALVSLAAWRDWLAEHGAAPSGTTGSAAWSLLRATLEDTLFCSFGTVPPILQTMGGRFEIGPRGPGTYEGTIAQVDLQAAYARELAGLRYGGRWYRSGELPGGGTVEWWGESGRPTFVHATVRVPAGLYGPLVRRPRKRMSQLGLFMSQLYQNRYPTATRLTGVWTWQELAAAADNGAKIQRVHDFYVHLAARRPFTRWWDAVQAGRRMPGLAGTLAKVTGNALWGRFCMDPDAGGIRTVRGAARRGGKVSSRPLPANGGMRPAHDLAELVSGRVRAEMYRLMARASEGLISAHTDGAWLQLDRSGPIGFMDEEVIVSKDGAHWRLKQPATRIDMIDPQTLRYWPTPSVPWAPAVVMAGVPAKRAPEAFERLWSKQDVVQANKGTGA